MAIADLLERGVKSVLGDPRTQAELRKLLTDGAMDADSAAHVRQALEALPGLLVSVERALAAPNAPLYARELLILALTDVREDHNPDRSHEGKPMLGLLVSVYMLHLVALELRSHLGRVDMRSVSGANQLLDRLLPRSVVTALREKVHEARETVRLAGRRRGPR